MLVQLVSDTHMKIHFKESLQTVKLQVDLQDPRNLIVQDTLLLYFDSANKCLYVKNMLEMSRVAKEKRHVSDCRVYLERMI